MLIGRFLGPSSPCRPLTDYTQGALEALPLQTTPKLCAITAALAPLCIQKGQMSIERALPCPEDIRTLAATDLANEFTAVPCSTDDLLEWHCVSDERHDDGIHLLAPEIPFILQPFGASEQFWIDHRRTDCGADYPHGAAYRVEEGRACVLHKVPTVGDLDGVGQRLCRGLTVAAATVARYDPDLRVVGKPSPHRCNLAIWEQGYDPPPLQIAHDCSVAMVLAKSPVVNASDDQRLRSRAGSSPNNSQQSIIAHRQHESLGEARCRPAAECQPQMVDDAFQPCRPARAGRENFVPEPLSENPPPTMRYLANESSRGHAEAYLLTPTWQIGDLSVVSAMDSARSHPAQWAFGRAAFGSHGQNNRVR